MESQRHANKAPGELMWTQRDEGETVFVFFHYSEDEKAAAESELSGTAGTPHRNTLINTGSLEELKPPATSC